MAARRYAQFFANGMVAEQTADDDWRHTTAHAEIRGGAFRIGFIGYEDSTFVNEAGEFASRRILLSVLTAGGSLAFYIRKSTGAGNSKVCVALDGDVLVERVITFSARQELTFTFDADEGSVTVSGATTGDGTTTGDGWSVPDNTMRIGGNVEPGGSNVARGWVSQPYWDIPSDDD